MKQGDIEPVQKHFQVVLVLEVPEELCGLASKGALADCGPRAQGQGAESIKIYEKQLMYPVRSS